MSPFTPVIDTTHSPHSRLRPVPISAVKLTDPFWSPRLERNRKDSIPALYHMLEEHGVMDNLRRVYGAYDGPRRGFLFTDSDIYKWIEAAAFVLASEDDAELRVLIDSAIDVILPAQGEDGYINSYFALERADRRWKELDHGHELYCAGHMIQGAIALKRATGDTRLFDAAVRFANLIDNVFRVGGLNDSDGHPEIEMALVELYRETRDDRYLKLAGYLLEQRGVTNRHEIWGHAVRACYYMAGATDYYLETGDTAYIDAIKDQWQDMDTRRSYITGGVGGRYTAESFGAPYELPNDRAYSESCAAIATMFWNWRLLHIDGDAKYADWFERTLYNGFLSSVSLPGTEYFYMNPLSCSGKPEDDPWYKNMRKPAYERTAWHACTCCPPNIERVFASLPGYMYSTSSDGLWVHLYATTTLKWQLEDDTPITVTQQTDYPWEGRIDLIVSPGEAREFSVFVRIPKWARTAFVKVRGEAVERVTPGRYLELRRVWEPGTRVELAFDMPVERLMSDFRAVENRGSVAVMRGPLLYALEGVDHGGEDVREFMLLLDSKLTPRRIPELDGVTVLDAEGVLPESPEPRPLYWRFEDQQPPTLRRRALRFIPYYAWNNRGPSSLAVWIPLVSVAPERVTA